MIKSSDILFYNSTNDAKLGTLLKSNTLDNFFNSLTGVANRDLRQQTGAFVIVNNHASLALTSARIYFRQVNPGGATLSMALDPVGPIVKTGTLWNGGGGTLTFTTPTTVGTGLLVSTLNPGFAVTVWIRRIATASAAVRPEKNTITISGTSAA